MKDYRLPELYDQVRNAQVQLGEARVRIKKSQREVALEEAWAATLEKRLQELASQISQAQREQTRTMLSPGGRR
jgi:DNA primase large subunit